MKTVNWKLEQQEKSILNLGENCQAEWYQCKVNTEHR